MQDDTSVFVAHETLCDITDKLRQVDLLVREAVVADGAENKQWFLEQIAELIGVTLPLHDPGTSP